MRAVWCGFALGVVWLQRQAALPGWRAWCVLGLIAAVAVCVAWAGGSMRGRFGLGLAIAWCAVWLAAACIGYGYAAWRAELRLASALPAAWESRDIVVDGYVNGLPAHDAGGARFLFEVESNDAGVASFPRTIRLSWISDDAPPPALEPGARWRRTVRLKRPHGNANFGVRDAEAALLARNIRATGYVNAPSTAVRLPGVAGGIGVAIDRWRAAVRADRCGADRCTASWHRCRARGARAGCRQRRRLVPDAQHGHESSGGDIRIAYRLCRGSSGVACRRIGCVLRVDAGGASHAGLEAASRGAGSGTAANPASVQLPKATTYPQLSALLAADIEAPVERILLARDREALRAQVLLVPHHGSKTSSTEPFLDSIDPLVPVFQVGYRNRFHHPHPGVFSRYVARYIELARKRYGWRGAD